MSLLSKLGFTATYVNTLVCTLNDAKVLDNQFLRITSKLCKTAPLYYIMVMDMVLDAELTLWKEGEELFTGHPSMREMIGIKMFQ